MYRDGFEDGTFRLTTLQDTIERVLVGLRCRYHKALKLDFHRRHLVVIVVVPKRATCRVSSLHKELTVLIELRGLLERAEWTIAKFLHAIHTLELVTVNITTACDVKIMKYTEWLDIIVTCNRARHTPHVLSSLSELIYELSVLALCPCYAGPKTLALVTNDYVPMLFEQGFFNCPNRRAVCDHIRIFRKYALRLYLFAPHCLNARGVRQDEYRSFTAFKFIDDLHTMDDRITLTLAGLITKTKVLL